MQSVPVAVLLAIVIAWLTESSSSTHIQESQNRLHNYLFNQPDAKWLHTFPFCDDLPETSNVTLSDYIAMRNSSLVNVAMIIYFNQLAGLDEKQQSASVKFSFILRWTDCRLTWEAAKFAGITSIVMNAREVDIFIPKLSLEERLSDDINWTDSSVTIQSDGTVTLQKTDTLLFGCDVDVQMYPFDSQDCSATFRSRTYDLDLLNLTAVDMLGERGHLDAYTPSDTWTLLDEGCEMSSYLLEVGIDVTNGDQTSNVSQIRKPFAQVVFSFTLQRQPFYEVVNLLLPALVTVVISGCVFFIPPGTTDKVGLSLTILLGMYVFTQLMYDKMPESGSTLPLLSLYFLICLAMICASCLLAVITANMSERRESCMHPWVHRVFMQWIGPRIRPDLFRSNAMRSAHRAHLVVKLQRWLHDRVALHGNGNGNGNGSAAENDVKVYTQLDTPKSELSEENSSVDSVGELMRNEWLLLAQVCDRVFLIVHLSVTLLLFLAFILAGTVHVYFC